MTELCNQNFIIARNTTIKSKFYCNSGSSCILLEAEGYFFRDRERSLDQKYKNSC